MFILEGQEEAPYVFIRTNADVNSWVAVLGAHELVIKRDNDSTLTLSRWSLSQHKSKLWAKLRFVYWEGQSASQPANRSVAGPPHRNKRGKKKATR